MAEIKYKYVFAAGYQLVTGKLNKKALKMFEEAAGPLISLVPMPEVVKNKRRKRRNGNQNM